jgi:hypothetical protein
MQNAYRLFLIDKKFPSVFRRMALKVIIWCSLIFAYCNGPNRFDKLRILIFKKFKRNVLNTVHLGGKCWSIVNFIDAFIGKMKSANLSLKIQVRARFEHNTKITVFMGKETLQNLLVRQFGEFS